MHLRKTGRRNSKVLVWIIEFGYFSRANGQFK
jgi:hypothetical protein